MTHEGDHDLLVRIETKLDIQIAQIGDHETRIRKLEILVWRASGAAAALGGGVGLVAQRLIGH